VGEPMLPITDEDCETFDEAERATFAQVGKCDVALRTGLTAVAAERDRRVAAQALRDAADDVHGSLLADPEGDFRDWLRERADELEAGRG
jgi:hypothetical protein